MRTAFLAAALAGFAGLGLLDLAGGRLKTGISALLLALANYLLLA